MPTDLKGRLKGTLAGQPKLSLPPEKQMLTACLHCISRTSVSEITTLVFGNPLNAIVEFNTQALTFSLYQNHSDVIPR